LPQWHVQGDRNFMRLIWQLAGVERVLTFADGNRLSLLASSLWRWGRF